MVAMSESCQDQAGAHCSKAACEGEYFFRSTRAAPASDLALASANSMLEITYCRPPVSAEAFATFPNKVILARSDVSALTIPDASSLALALALLSSMLDITSAASALASAL